jgi:pimeloyl-ACP methyl ester carboxylesterase
MTDHRVTVDGRTVALTQHGDPDGVPVFLLHGTPDSRVGKEFVDTPARERGLRVLCPDRPGIGGSDPQPGRTLAGYADDVLALADVLGVDRFATVGYSCGGPFALACAAGCGPRVTGTALMAGAGPIDDRPGAKEGLAKSDLDVLELLEKSPRREAMSLRVQKWATQLVPSAAIGQVSAELREPDREFLWKRTAREEMAFFVEALRQGPAGVMDEYRLWASPWRLDWAAITTPVEIFQGEEDGMVPMHHAEDIASRLPAGTGRLHRLPGVGHLSIQEHAAEVLDALTTP